MTTPTEVEALISRLNAAALSDPHDEREVMCAPLLREAAATLAAQQARIASWEQVWDNVRIDIPNLRENNKPLAVAASYALLKARAERAEAALRQAEADARRYRMATQFYAKHEHWMAPAGDSDGPCKLLIANGDTESVEGWAVAEAAIDAAQGAKP